MVQALLKAGADPNVAGARTPRAAVALFLDRIYHISTVASVRLLLDRGAPLVQTCPTAHTSLLDQALQLCLSSWRTREFPTQMLALIDLLAAHGERWSIIPRPVDYIANMRCVELWQRTAVIKHLVTWHRGDPQVRCAFLHAWSLSLCIDADNSALSENGVRHTTYEAVSFGDSPLP